MQRRLTNLHQPRPTTVFHTARGPVRAFNQSVHDIDSVEHRATFSCWIGTRHSQLHVLLWWRLRQHGCGARQGEERLCIPLVPYLFLVGKPPYRYLKLAFAREIKRLLTSRTYCQPGNPILELNAARTLNGKNSGNQLSMFFDILSFRWGCMLSPTFPYRTASKYPASLQGTTRYQYT
jgi:hypothetical protein